MRKYVTLLYICTVNWIGLALLLHIFCFMQVGTTDPNAYFSCDDHFPIVEKAVSNDQELHNFQDQSIIKDRPVNISHDAISPEGICLYNFIMATNFLDYARSMYFYVHRTWQLGLTMSSCVLAIN